MPRNPMAALATATAIATAATAVPAAAQTSPIVQTDRGKVAGAVSDGVASWKGIPFAQPPVGALRWRAPQPAQRWSGVRQATAYSHDCMQKPFPSDAAPLGTEPAEDCLYANVWKPAGAARKMPVMVWVYGGGFVNGGASPPTYAGAAMAKKGVMFVSFNYRVGRFGTFALPQLTAANADGGRLGNYGIMDQIAALKWVRQNIAAFGGDPSNVTIIGESAGGISMHFLVTSPEARGLFQKAFVMSGGDARTDTSVTLAKVEEVGGNFARSKGIDPAAPDALAKLRALTAEQVTDGLNMGYRPSGPPTNSGPFADGTVVVDVAKAYADGRFAKMPMVIGATSADIGGKSGFMIAGSRNASAVLADKGVPVWQYRFSYVAQSVGQPGAQHASDIPFFFNNTAIKYGDKTTPRDVAMGDTISNYIVDFVKTGNPNGSGLPDWPKYTRANDVIMDFTADGTAVAARDPWGQQIEQAEQALARAKASGHYTTLTTPIGKLLDDPAARAILASRVPQVVGNPQIGMARGFPLATLQAYMPAQLSDDMMKSIDDDLAKIPMKP
jgi:para-nitrobenzyl esterase